MLLEQLGAQTLVLTGVAGNFCVLFPRTTRTCEHARYALAHMAGVTKADVRPSAELRLELLVNQVREAQ